MHSYVHHSNCAFYQFKGLVTLVDWSLDEPMVPHGRTSWCKSSTAMPGQLRNITFHKDTELYMNPSVTQSRGKRTMFQEPYYHIMWECSVSSYIDSFINQARVRLFSTDIMALMGSITASAYDAIMVNVSKTSEANVPYPRPMWDADDAFYVVIRPGGWQWTCYGYGWTCNGLLSWGSWYSQPSKYLRMSSKTTTACDILIRM